MIYREKPLHKPLAFDTHLPYTAPVFGIFNIIRNMAEVAEQADAPDSKSGDGDIMWVRPPPSAPIIA